MDTGVGSQAGVTVRAAPCGLAARLREAASRPALSAKRSSGDRQALEPTCWLRRLALPRTVWPSYSPNSAPQITPEPSGSNKVDTSCDDAGPARITGQVSLF